MRPLFCLILVFCVTSAPDLVASRAWADSSDWRLPAVRLPAVRLPDSLTAEEVARAVAIVDGDTLVLADGRQVRLAGIQAPKPPSLPANDEAWSRMSVAEAARRVLSELALGRTLRLAYGGRRLDRHGRVLAHAQTPDGRWIQGQLLQAGLARVYTFADNRAAAGDMLALEAAAREAGRGIWSLAGYAVLDAQSVVALGDGARVGGFQIVEGRPRKVAQVRGRAYLNFGDDWRHDFTVTLDRDALERFRVAGIDPLVYEGRRLRVRGWVKFFNGPMIEVTHPEQIEVLAE